MKNFNIKNINFKEFIDVTWNKWKYRSLNEADENVKDAFAAEFPGGESTSRLPILFDEDDWKFLSNFPSKLWTQALQWRYNKGLLLASQLRETYVNSKGDKDIIRNILSVHGWKDRAIDRLLSGCKNRYDPNCVLPDRMSVHLVDKDGQYRFHNVYVGYKKLFDKLEKPIKIYGKGIKGGAGEHKISVAGNPYMGREKDEKYRDLPGAGIGDIDINAETPEEVRSREGLSHKSNYKGGFYDFDLTRPIEITPEMIDKLPDDDPHIVSLIDGDKIKTPEDAKKLLKKNPPVHFAGMPTLTSASASRNLQTWYKATGLGLLGDFPQEVTIDGEKYSVADGTLQYKTAEEIKEEYPNFYERIPKAVGEGGKKQGLIKLWYPIIKKKINYNYKPKGSESVIPIRDEEIVIPYLLPGKVFPLLDSEALDQYKSKIKERRNRSGDTSQVGSVDELLNNIDLILSDDEVAAIKKTNNPEQIRRILSNNEQFNKLKNSDKNLFNLLARKALGRAEYNRLFGKAAADVKLDSPEDADIEDMADKGVNAEEEIAPFYGTVGRGEDYYGVGLTLGKNQRHRWPLNMTQDQLESAIKNYLEPKNKDSKVNLLDNNTWLAGERSGGGCPPYGLYGEACRGVSYFIHQLKQKVSEGKQNAGTMVGKKKANKLGDIAKSEMVIEMMEAAFDEVVNVAAALLVLNLNHPIAGIYDPDAGMHVLHPRFRSDKGKKASQNYRMGMAYRFAHDLSQAALTGSSLTRRARQKAGGAMSGDSEGLDNKSSSNLDAKVEERRRVWYRNNRRAEDDKVIVTRPAWLVPVNSGELKKYLYTLSHEIKEKVDKYLGSDYAESAEKAGEIMTAISNTQIDLYLDEYFKYKDRNQEPNQAAIEKSVQSKLATELKKRHPEAFKDMDEKELNSILGSSDQPEKDLSAVKLAHEGTSKGFDYTDIITALTSNFPDDGESTFEEVQKNNSKNIQGLIVPKARLPFLLVNLSNFRNAESADDLTEPVDYTYEDIVNKIKATKAVDKITEFLTKNLFVTQESVNNIIVKLIMDVEGKNQEQAIREAAKRGYNPKERQGKQGVSIANLQYNPLSKLATGTSGFKNLIALNDYVKTLGGQDNLETIRTKVAATMEFLVEKNLISRNSITNMIRFLKDQQPKDRAATIIHTLAAYLSYAKQESDDEQVFGDEV